MARKHRISLLILAGLVALTVAMLVQANDIGAVFQAICSVSVPWLGLGVATALLFVALEGGMIWYLVRALRPGVCLCTCVGWSFAGFFFSAITPSSTGGQPMQVYYMKRAGIPVAESAPVLMMIAVLYKLDIFLIGVAICCFRQKGLVAYLGGYHWLFYLGMALNAVVVGLLILVMSRPALAEKVVLRAEHLLVILRIAKPSTARRTRLTEMVADCEAVVKYFGKNRRKTLVVAAITFAQRLLPFLLSWIIYRGMGLAEEGILQLMVLQAAVTITVDLLPLPGSAGITELVAATAFATVFPGELLAAFLCLSRGIGFYSLLIISAAVVVRMQLRKGKLPEQRDLSCLHQDSRKMKECS